MGKKYYSVLNYAKKKNQTSQTIYNQIKANKLDYIEVDIGEVGRKGYVIVEDDDKV